MWEWILQLQREIYLTFASHIRAFAENGDWPALLAFVPFGVVFGAVHALTPGHSKAVLATYLAGTDSRLVPGLLVSLALSVTHVTSAVIIAGLSLPLATLAFGTASRAPLLEDISRGMLGLVGLWMLWQALRHRPHAAGPGAGATFGVVAGMIPCPLTLFVMTAAMARGVPAAGLVFALTMLSGVALTLSAVAMAAVTCRQRLARLVGSDGRLLHRMTRVLSGAAGIVLILVATAALLPE